MMVRFLSLPSLILLAYCFVAPAAASSHDDRLSLARDMANMTLTLITDPTKKAGDRIANLKRGFSNVVDTSWIARFVLGNAWRKATPEQRSHYSQLYHEFLMHTYISTYATDDSQKVTDITVLGVKDEADGQFTTRTEVRLSNAKTLKVDYRVHSKDDEYKIIDVTIEGISLLSTHRNEFAQTVARTGLDGVIEKLKQQVN